MRTAAALALLALMLTTNQGCVFDEAKTFDYDPIPHGDFGGDYAVSWLDNQGDHACHIGNEFMYYFMNTNQNLPPYDRWYPEQLQGEWTTIHRTIDFHFFNYDWDNPYVDG
jgi:hypothetical protein